MATGEAEGDQERERRGRRRDPELALAGKVSRDLLDVIRKRPMLFGQLLRGLRDTPDQAVLRLVREARDGEW